MRRDEAFEWWLSGVIDSKAFFEINRYTKGKGEGNIDVKITLKIPFKMGELMLADEVIKNLGFGKVIPVRSREGTILGTIRERLYIGFNTASELRGICEILDRRRLRGDRLMMYSIWRDAVQLRLEEFNKPLRGRWSKNTRAKLDSLIRKMRKVKKAESVERVAS